MKTILEHIEHIQGKPHHIRKRVAAGAAAVAAGGIALVWVIGTLSTGGFAIQGSSFADSAGQGTLEVAGTENTSQNIAGAAAALGNESAPAHIEIVDTSSSTRSGKQAEQTVIPF